MRAYRDRQRTLEQLQTHLRVWARELSAWEVIECRPITGWETRAPGGEWHPIAIGEGWDNRIGIHEFRTTEAVAGSADVAADLRLDFGGEALVRLTDASSGTALQAFSANPKHPRFSPVPQAPFTIRAEVAARSLFGVPQREPRLMRAEVLQFHPEVRALRQRIEIAAATSKAVDDPELARALCEAVEIALTALRLPTATADVGPRVAGLGWATNLWERSFEPTATPAAVPQAALQSVVDATEMLDAQLAELRAAYPKQGKVLATGHAHIDYAWLWPQPETVRKIERTFSHVDALMGRYDDFTFLQSSSLYYRHIEEEAPELLQRIQQRVAEGRWEAIGGMFVECDTNMPSAEAFLRQFLLGQSDFERYFGAPSRTAWLPDTFGFTGAMPQIMLHAGIETLVTIKVTWNETNGLPDNLFLWRGNDGSEVLTHTFDAYHNDGYNMQMTPAALKEVWHNHLGKDLTDTVIASYGWGDGGGGPDPDQIEAMPILNLMPALPSIGHGSIQQHLDSVHRELADARLPVWTGELYLEYHRATLTSQARTKQLNRRAEYGLVAAEALGALASLSGAEASEPDLSEQWALALRNQFHDILPGSSIREVYEQSEAEMEGVVSRAEGVATDNLAAIAAQQAGGRAQSGIAIANISGSAKPSWQIASRDPLPAALQPQAVGDGYVATGNVPLAPLSVSFVGGAAAAPSVLSVSPRGLENDLVRVRLDDAGRVTSLFDKRCGRELIEGAGNRLMLYRNDLPRNFDAWDIEPGFEIHGEELTDVQSIAVTAEGPHLAEITIVRRFSASTIRQQLRLWANSARLDFVTEMDWHDRRCYLRAEFPVTVLAPDAQFDQAIGVTARATHTNTSWQKAQFEACGHRFVSLAETEWGCALLSSDKYGFSAKQNVLTLSLVRGPMYPDMLADEGVHRFTYSLLPHDGRWWSDAVQAEADLVADPLRFQTATADADYVVRPVRWSGLPLRFHALKRAEDGAGHVLRVSEAGGRRGATTLEAQGKAVEVVDGLERPVTDGTLDTLRPFQLSSVRLR